MIGIDEPIPPRIALDDILRAALAPRERIPVSTWADRHRVLSGKRDAQPGPWHTELTPYLAEIMDSFCDTRAKIIVCVKSSRVGLTESGNNMIGYAIDQAPGPILYVYPTEGDAKEESDDRIRKMIESSPRLTEHIPHAGWFTQEEMTLDSLTIYMAWAKSQRTLIRRTIRYVFIDELDNCDQQSGKLGETLSLVTDRTTTFQSQGKVVIYSTPTTAHASAWQTWEASDKRRYHVPCPLCGVYQVLAFDRIRVPDEERSPDRIEIDDLAWYECSECRGELRDRKHKRWMTARGVWVPEAQKIVQALPLGDPEIVSRAAFGQSDRWTPEIEGDKPRMRQIGFHIWSAYSPWRSWSEIMAKWFRVKDDREKRIVFVNQWLGEPWEEVVNTASVKGMRGKLLEALPRCEVPEDGKRLVCGVDVQRDRIWFTVRAWGANCESWLVDHGYFARMSDREDVIDALERWYLSAFSGATYKRIGGSGGTCRPIVALIDSGDGDVTRQIYEFCKVHPGCFACKGEDSTANHYVRKSATEPKRRNKEVVHPLTTRQLWLVNTGKCKDTLYAFANKDGDGPNTFHLHADVDDDYIHQFTAEHKVYDKTKKRDLWKVKSVGRANHLLDCEVYGLAAAEIVGGLSIVSGAQSSRPAKRARRPADARNFLSRYSHSI